MLNLAEAAAIFVDMGFEYDRNARAALDRGCVIIEDEAKRVIGTYDYGWPTLAASTIASKANGDTPLLETGEMRDSIEHTVIDRNNAEVGSNNDKALWQELGTSRGIPPRSFLGGAAAHKGVEAADEIAGEFFNRMVRLSPP